MPNLIRRAARAFVGLVITEGETMPEENAIQPLQPEEQAVPVFEIALPIATEPPPTESAPAPTPEATPEAAPEVVVVPVPDAAPVADTTGTTIVPEVPIDIVKPAVETAESPSFPAGPDEPDEPCKAEGPSAPTVCQDCFEDEDGCPVGCSKITQWDYTTTQRKETPEGTFITTITTAITKKVTLQFATNESEIETF
jgi:hypothetical protein